MTQNNPFNNQLEIGLRLLSILNEAFPKKINLQSLLYIDYIIIHSGDFDNTTTSIHAPVPYRESEIFIRRNLIKDSLDFLLYKNLVDIIYDADGISYIATEDSTPFLDKLSELYTKELLIRVKWFFNKYESTDELILRTIFSTRNNLTNTEFNIGILK
ncbi:ABC-three component system middle component 2 [Chryseobacterium hispalense]|uniref:ABC-three component system middle component 2 n=1 Tax=Chryseobacterium hispalense TaxID=1453492 RepID=UPI00068EC6EF|nr:ABC-three component system middle component 2 [Chryseobacterium hispalense]